MASIHWYPNPNCHRVNAGPEFHTLPTQANNNASLVQIKFNQQMTLLLPSGGASSFEIPITGLLLTLELNNCTDLGFAKSSVTYYYYMYNFLNRL